MKIVGAIFGTIGLLAAGSANAALMPGNAIYSSFVQSVPGFADNANNKSFPMVPVGTGVAPGSPNSQQFHATAGTVIDSLWLRLSASNPTDGGSILVYIVPSNGSGGVLAGANPQQLGRPTLLGTILDSSLPNTTTPGSGCVFGGVSATIDLCNTFLDVSNYTIPTDGDYWISLVDGADANNGGTGSQSSSVWWRSKNSSLTSGTVNPGLNTQGKGNSHVNGGGVMNNQKTDAFEMQVNVVAAPEPASMALLGVGLLGLGMAYRRSRKSNG